MSRLHSFVFFGLVGSLCVARAAFLTFTVHSGESCTTSPVETAVFNKIDVEPADVMHCQSVLHNEKGKIWANIDCKGKELRWYKPDKGCRPSFGDTSSLGGWPFDAVNFGKFLNGECAYSWFHQEYAMLSYSMLDCKVSTCGLQLTDCSAPPKQVSFLLWTVHQGSCWNPPRTTAVFHKPDVKDLTQCQSNLHNEEGQSGAMLDCNTKVLKIYEPNSGCSSSWDGWRFDAKNFELLLNGRCAYSSDHKEYAKLSYSIHSICGPKQVSFLTWTVHMGASCTTPPLTIAVFTKPNVQDLTQCQSTLHNEKGRMGVMVDCDANMLKWYKPDGGCATSLGGWRFDAEDFEKLLNGECAYSSHHEEYAMLSYSILPICGVSLLSATPKRVSVWGLKV